MFYQKLKKRKVPFFVLAPMEDVTDTVFRQVINKCGRPEIFVTEFTSCEGIQSVGQARVIHRLKYDEIERPIIAQVWGITPKNYYDTAKLVLELGFDGMDINMGCPVKNVIKQGACSALIKNHQLAKEILNATKEALNGQIPLSVKTRIGFKAIETDVWCRFLLEQNLDCLTIHGRTVAEESKADCHWDEIAKVVKIRDEIAPNTIIIGNGDIFSKENGLQKAIESGVDGIMIGRGVFKNPWIFNQDYQKNDKGEIWKNGYLVGQKERLELLSFHIQKWQQIWGETKNYSVLKKYFKIYLSGFEGAVELRTRFMETKNIQEAINLF